MPAATFRNTMYPWFEPETAPGHWNELAALLARPAVRERVSESELRFVIVIGGATDRNDEGFFFCGGAYAGAGCLGFGSESLDTRLNAAVWDLATGASAATMTSTASGENVSIGVLVPILFISRTEVAACEELGRELGRILARPVGS